MKSLVLAVLLVMMAPTSALAQLQRFNSYLPRCTVADAVADNCQGFVRCTIGSGLAPLIQVVDAADEADCSVGGGSTENECICDVATGNFINFVAADPSGGGGPHAATHSENQSDEVLVENLGTGSLSSAEGFMSDGLGGVILVDLATQAELDSHAALTTTHGVSGSLVGTSDTQTLTNKTINGDNNDLLIRTELTCPGAGGVVGELCEEPNFAVYVHNGIDFQLVRARASIVDSAVAGLGLVENVGALDFSPSELDALVWGTNTVPFSWTINTGGLDPVIVEWGDELSVFDANKLAVKDGTPRFGFLDEDSGEATLDTQLSTACNSIGVGTTDCDLYIGLRIDDQEILHGLLATRAMLWDADADDIWDTQADGARIGDGVTNYARFGPDGTLTFAGTATLVLAGDVDGSVGATDLDELAVEAELEAVLDLADLQERDIDSLTGQTAWDSAATKTTADLVISGVEIDYEAGASEGFPRLAQSATPPALECDAAAEAGRLYLDTDADTDGSVFFCRGVAGWKEIDDDGGAGGGNAWTTIGTAVADVAGDTMTVTDSLSIDIITSDEPEDLSAAFRYDQTLAGNPALGTEECVFTVDGAGGGGFLCEGTGVGDLNEQLYLLPPVNGADTTSWLVLGPGATVTSGALASWNGTDGQTLQEPNFNGECTALDTPFDCCTGLDTGTCVPQISAAGVIATVAGVASEQRNDRGQRMTVLEDLDNGANRGGFEGAANFTADRICTFLDAARLVPGACLELASETVAAALEIATQAEADTGADDARAITPSKLATFGGTFNSALTFGGNVNVNDGVGDSPLLIFTPQTGIAWNLLVADVDDDFRIVTNSAVTELVEIANVGAGVADLNVDGSVTAANLSGTNTGDEALSTGSAGLDVADHAVDLDVTPSVGNATLEQAEDALQVLYDTEALSETASGLTIATGGVDGGAGGEIQDGTIDHNDLGSPIIFAAADRIEFTEQVTPAAAPAGTVRIYAKNTATAELCSIDDAGTETCMSTGTGGSTRWDQLLAPQAATSLVSDAVTETVVFSFESAFTAGAQFQIRQQTGNPTGGTLVDIRAADTDVTVLAVGDGTNGIAVSQAGALAATGTGSITATDVVCGSACINGSEADSTFVLDSESPAASGQIGGTFAVGLTLDDNELGFEEINYGQGTDPGLAINEVWLTSSGLVYEGNVANGNELYVTPGAADAADATLTLPWTTDTLVGRATTDTLTNKTLDVEGTGNVVTVLKQSPLDFASCIGGTAANAFDDAGDGSTAPTAACNDTGSIQRPSADFSGSAVNCFERTFRLPDGWTGNIDLDIRYVTTAATPTGNVEWDVSTVCRAVGEVWDGTFNAAQTITDAVAAQNVLNDATQAAVTTTGCAAEEDLTLRICRDGLNDTNNDLAKGLSAQLTLRDAQ